MKRSPTIYDRSIAAAFFMLCLAGQLKPCAAQQADSPGAVEDHKPRVVARVDGLPIYQYEVDDLLRRGLGRRDAPAEQHRQLQVAALDQLINKRLIVQFARSRKHLVSEADLAQAWQQMLKQLASQELTLKAYLQSKRRAEEELRHSVAWPVAWNALLTHYATPENLQRHFEQHRRRFDGTQLRVAQIFLRTEPTTTPEEQHAKLQQAHKIRAKLADGTTTFDEAAKRHSQAPSAAAGGVIGWIDQQGSLPEACSQAAYALSEGQVSQPIVSPLGVHLLKVLEVKPGSKTWQQARPALTRSVYRHLLLWAADVQRKQSTVVRVGLN